MVEYILLIIFYYIFKEEDIMTKKKILAAVSAAAMATSLFATTAFAAGATVEWNNNGGSATGEGESWTRNPVIEVEIPYELPFAINPYKLDLREDTSAGTAITDQIWSDNYLIINNSEVPVAVTTKSKAEAGTSSNLTIETAPKYNTNTGEMEGTDATKKNAFIGMQFAKTATYASEAYTFTYDTLAFSSTAIKDKASLQAAGGLVLGGTDETVTLVLDKAPDTPDDSNVAAFKYVGVVNNSTTEAYTDADIKVTTVYELKVLTDNASTTGYQAVATGDNAQGALNVMKSK